MRRNKISLIFCFLCIFLLNSVSFVSAFTPVPQTSPGIGCGEGFGPIAKILCANPSPETTGNQLNNVVSVIIGVMTTVAALWFIIQFITAGFQWIQSGGDKTNLEQARDKITNSLIGLIIVVSAWIVMGIVGTILGIQIINPGEILIHLGK